MRELFIYYRVRAHNAGAAKAVVMRIQQRLRADHPGLVSRWLRRCDADDQMQTWMETYAIMDEHGITPTIQSNIESNALELRALIEGARHIEAFAAIDGSMPASEIVSCAS